MVEIISPTIKGRDLIDKKELYEEAGVREYWVVDKEKLYKNILVNGVYNEKIIKTENGIKIDVDILEGCVLNF